MKYMVIIVAFCILLLSSCTTYNNLDQIDVCPELIEVVTKGWKQKTKKEDSIQYCTKNFDDEFRRYLEEEFCKNSLTKMNIMALLGPPNEIIQSDIGGEVMGIYEDASEYDSLVYYCTPCKSLFKKQNYMVTRTYYFCVNKSTREYVGYYAKGNPYID